MQSAFGKASASKSYRDVTGQGGYVYRVYTDGQIQILQSPRGGAGSYVPQGSSAYNAILQEVYDSGFTGVSGTSRGKKVTAEGVLKTTERITGVASSGVDIAERVSALLRGQTVAAPMDVDPSLYEPVETTSTGTPWGLILGVGGVVVGVGVLALVLSGKD